MADKLVVVTEKGYIKLAHSLPFHLLFTYQNYTSIQKSTSNINCIAIFYPTHSIFQVY